VIIKVTWGSSPSVKMRKFEKAHDSSLASWAMFVLKRMTVLVAV
jgi:hypothetical protein